MVSIRFGMDEHAVCTVCVCVCGSHSSSRCPSHLHMPASGLLLDSVFTILIVVWRFPLYFVSIEAHPFAYAAAELAVGSIVPIHFLISHDSIFFCFGFNRPFLPFNRSHRFWYITNSIFFSFRQHLAHQFSVVSLSVPPIDGKHILLEKIVYTF